MIPAGYYGFRIFQPGYGPKIIVADLSDLGPFPSGTGPFTDLRTQNIYCTGSGAPSATTLSAGNYSATIGGSGYLAGDAYFDKSGKGWWVCTTGGANAGSAWNQISGSGGSDTQYTITAVNQNTVTATDPHGNSVTIYKPLELQGSLSGETIYGDAVTYSSYGTNYNIRTATDSSGNTETQYITPEYTVGQIITAVTVATSGVSFLEERKPDRQWGGQN